MANTIEEKPKRKKEDVEERIGYHRVYDPEKREYVDKEYKINHWAPKEGSLLYEQNHYRPTDTLDEDIADEFPPTQKTLGFQLNFGTQKQVELACYNEEHDKIGGNRYEVTLTNIDGDISGDFFEFNDLELLTMAKCLPSHLAGDKLGQFEERVLAIDLKEEDIKLDNGEVKHFLISEKIKELEALFNKGCTAAGITLLNYYKNEYENQMKQNSYPEEEYEDGYQQCQEAKQKYEAFSQKVKNRLDNEELREGKRVNSQLTQLKNLFKRINDVDYSYNTAYEYGSDKYDFGDEGRSVEERRNEELLYRQKNLYKRSQTVEKANFFSLYGSGATRHPKGYQISADPTVPECYPTKEVYDEYKPSLKSSLSYVRTYYETEPVIEAVSPDGHGYFQSGYKIEEGHKVTGKQWGFNFEGKTVQVDSKKETLLSPDLKPIDSFKTSLTINGKEAQWKDLSDQEFLTIAQHIPQFGSSEGFKQRILDLDLQNESFDTNKDAKFVPTKEKVAVLDRLLNEGHTAAGIALMNYYRKDMDRLSRLDKGSPLYSKSLEECKYAKERYQYISERVKEADNFSSFKEQFDCIESGVSGRTANQALQKKQKKKAEKGLMAPPLPTEKDENILDDISARIMKFGIELTGQILQNGGKCVGKTLQFIGNKIEQMLNNSNGDKR